MKFLFICEYNKTTGLGHFDRCLNFANLLKQKQHECIFLSFNSDKNLIKTYKSINKFKFINIPQTVLTKKNILEFCSLVYKFNSDFLVFDSYKIKYNFFVELNNYNLKSIVIADFANKKYFCDILINPNSKKKFKNLKKNSSVLSGINYQFIDDEYFKKKKFKMTQNALIYLGSVKKINFIEKIILQLNNFFKKEIKYQIILKNKIKFKYKNIKILDFMNKQNLKNQIDKSKFIISAGGTFLPKCLVRNKIIFALKTADNQNELLKYLDENKLIFFLNSKKNNLNKNKYLLLNKKTKNSKINYKKKFNKNKTYKILLNKFNKIKKDKIYLVSKNKNQIKDIYNIQTGKNVRKYSQEKKFISYNEHKKWFKNMIISKLYHHFLIKKNSLTIGLVSFKPLNNYLLISIIVKKKFRKKNIAYNAINISLMDKNILGKNIIAIVKKQNTNSIKLFKKLNFSLNNKKKLYMKLI